MKKSNDFHDFIVYDLLGNLGNITSGRMMSGWCVYSEGIPFGAIIGNNFYVKTKNPNTIQELQNTGSSKFEYQKKDGKTISMNYWLVPEEMLDDSNFVQKIAEQVIEENVK